MNYPFKSFTSLVYISFLIQKGGIHLCRDNSWCVTKQYSTEKTLEVICISQWDDYLSYILSSALTRTSCSGNCHTTFSNLSTQGRSRYTPSHCAHAALSTLMDFYFQGPTGLRAAWCKDDWFPSCRYAQWFKDMTWGTLTVWRSTESSPHQQTTFYL